jgi:hypothetical protein
LDQVTPAGVVTARGALPGAAGPTKFHDAVVYGTATTSVLFITTGNGQVMEKYLTFGSINDSAGEPKYVALATTSNRLVQGGYVGVTDTPTGSNGSPSTVYFSDPGVPETYQTNNYVMLYPGDGEAIRGMATWRDQTFVFKESNAFIFYGESTDSSGQPIFNYRALTLNGRIPPAAAAVWGPVVAVGSLGIYYLALDGVYRTTGGPPVKISGALNPLFDTGALRPHTISVVDTQVFVHTTTGLYVYDEDHGQWTARTYGTYTTQYECPMAAWPIFSESASGDPSTLFFAPARTLVFTKRGATTDDGGAIASSYRSGFSELDGGEDGPAVKTVRQSQVWGTGTMTYSMGVDYAAPDAGTSLALGVAPFVNDRMERKARRGTSFCFNLSAASGAWQVDEVTMMLRPPRDPGAKPS